MFLEIYLGKNFGPPYYKFMKKFGKNVVVSSSKSISETEEW